MRAFLFAAFLLSLAAPDVPGAAAQPLPDSLVWEHLGPWRPHDSALRMNADFVAFDFDGRLLAMSQNGHLDRWRGPGHPDSLAWELVDDSIPASHADYRFTDDGTPHGLGIRQRGDRLHRSHDGGETWTPMFEGSDAETWPARAPDGAWLVGTHGPWLLRSTD